MHPDFVDVSMLEPNFEYFSLASITASQPWTPEEDQQLQGLVHLHGAKNWSQVASLITGRTGKQCRERWRNHIDPSITKEPFTSTEDSLIISLVEEMGTKWAKIAKSLPGRTDNSIKNRYYSSLLKKSHERRLNRFSAHEDALIISVVRRLGTRWSEVAKFLPGRTSKSIKNRYYSALKKSYPLAAMAAAQGNQARATRICNESSSSSDQEHDLDHVVEDSGSECCSTPPLCALKPSVSAVIAMNNVDSLPPPMTSTKEHNQPLQTMTSTPAAAAATMTTTTTSKFSAQLAGLTVDCMGEDIILSAAMSLCQLKHLAQL